MKKIVIATKNAGKVREMKDAFAHLPVEVVALSEFGQLPNAIEDGETFAENAAIKAKFYMEKTGCACLADDSGLEVAVLGGRPGVYSSRYAGYNAEDWANNQKMLEELHSRCGRIPGELSLQPLLCGYGWYTSDGRWPLRWRRKENSPWQEWVWL